MPTPTYTHITTTTLSSNTAIVGFNGLSALNYKDLVISMEVWGTTTEYAYTRMNEDSGTNYQDQESYGTNVQARFVGTLSHMPLSWAQSTFNSTEFTQIDMNVFDYKDTNKSKVILFRMNTASAAATAMHGGRWNDTAALNYLSFHCSSGQFKAGSKFHIYGIEG